MNLMVSSTDPAVAVSVLDDHLLLRGISDCAHALGHAVYYHTSDHLVPIDVSARYQRSLISRWMRRDRRHYLWGLRFLECGCAEYRERLGGVSEWDAYLPRLGRLDVVECIPLVSVQPIWELLVGTFGLRSCVQPFYWANLSGSKTYSDLAFSTLLEMQLDGLRTWPEFTVLPCGLYQTHLIRGWLKNRVRIGGSWVSGAACVSRAKALWDAAGAAEDLTWVDA